jgi:hypothetical protein
MGRTGRRRQRRELNDKDRIFQQIPRNREGLIAELQPAPAGENPAARLVEWTIVLPKG